MMLFAVLVRPIIFAPILLKFYLFPELSSINKGLLIKVSTFILGVLCDGHGGNFEILLSLLLYNLEVFPLLILSGIFFVIFWLSGHFSIFGIFSLFNFETILDGVYEEMVLSRTLDELSKVLYLLLFY
jgi:hypothetical protein